MDYNQSLERIDTELLLDYIEGLLSPQARLRVETALAGQEALRVMEAGARHLLIEEGLDRGEVEAWLYSSLPEIPAEAGFYADAELPMARAAASPVMMASKKQMEPDAGSIPMQSTTLRAPKKMWMPAAAAILFFLLGGTLAWYLIPGVSPERLALGYLEEPYGSNQALRGEVDTSPMAAAMAAYHEMAYAEAAAMFAAIASQQDLGMITQASFYEALCHLYATTPDYARASRLMEQVMNSESEAYSQQARWYRSLALILAGKKKEALPLLETIVEDEDHFRNAQASVMLRTLR